MEMEMDEPLLRPNTPASAHSSSTSSIRSTFRSLSNSHSRSSSSSSSFSPTTHRLSIPFSHSKFPFSSQHYPPSTSAPPSTFNPTYRKPSSSLSRTRSLCSKLNTEVKFMRLKFSRNEKTGKGKGKWIKVEGEGEGERRVEMVWRRMDGGQGMIPWGGVGRDRLD